MQEFSSISVSSYEAGVLAERLTERSSEGWSVVAIVPTGSTVTAYLSRATGTVGDAHTDSAPESVAEEVSVEEVADEVAVAEVAVAEVAVADEVAMDVVEVAEQAGAEAPTGLESAVAEIVPHEVAREAAEGVGWAASSGDSVGSNDPVPEISPSVPEVSPATEAAVQPESAGATAEVAAAAASSGAAPAGWYADPSSRFELRYWDGSQWTEHVSRSGQQYTDPPVA